MGRFRRELTREEKLKEIRRLKASQAEIKEHVQELLCDLAKMPPRRKSKLTHFNKLIEGLRERLRSL